MAKTIVVFIAAIVLCQWAKGESILEVVNRHKLEYQSNMHNGILVFLNTLEEVRNDTRELVKRVKENVGNALEQANSDVSIILQRISIIQQELANGSSSDNRNVTKISTSKHNGVVTTTATLSRTTKKVKPRTAAEVNIAASVKTGSPKEVDIRTSAKPAEFTVTASPKQTYLTLFAEISTTESANLGHAVPNAQIGGLKEAAKLHPPLNNSEQINLNNVTPPSDSIAV